MPSITSLSIELQIKEGVHSLRRMMGTLFDKQIMFLTRLRRRFIQESATSLSYELQKDVSAVLFNMAIALALSEGRIPLLNSADLAKNSDVRTDSRLEDEEAERLFGSSFTPPNQIKIETLTGKKTIKDFREEQLRTARKLSAHMEEMLTARDRTTLNQRHTESDGQSLEDGRPSNGAPRTPSQYSNSERLPGQSAASTQTRTRRSYAQSSENGTRNHSMRDAELTNGTPMQGRRDQVQQAPNSDAQYQSNDISSILRGMDNKSLLEQRQEQQKKMRELERRASAQSDTSIVSNSTGVTIPVTGFLSSSSTGTVTVSMRQAPGWSTSSHASRARQPESPSSTRRRSLQSSHHSNNSAPDGERRASSSAIGQASGRANASNRPPHANIQAESRKSSSLDHEMFVN